MKVKTHIRVAKNGRTGRTTVAASTRASVQPLYDSQNRTLPTVAFALVLDVPDELFRQAEKVIAEIEVKGTQAKIAAEVKTV